MSESRGQMPHSGPGGRWLLPLLAAIIVAGGAAAYLLLVEHSPVTPLPGSDIAGLPTTQSRFTPGSSISDDDISSLRWEEVSQMASALPNDPSELERITRLAVGSKASPAIYLGALILFSQKKAEQALITWETLDPSIVPPTFLYAPYRLHQTLRPSDPNPYLPALRKAVSEGKVSALISARIQVRDGELAAALKNYLKTDPADWASYDLVTLQSIGNHEGLAADLSKMVAGALASGRVKSRLAPTLQRIARQPGTQPDLEAFKRNLQRAIDEKTPEGEAVIESAKRMLRDRKLFLSRHYKALLKLHLEDEPIELPTETALLLFLAAVDLKEQIEVDRWGQELKRRHNDPEVRDWVNEMTAAAR